MNSKISFPAGNRPFCMASVLSARRPIVISPFQHSSEVPTTRRRYAESVVRFSFVDMYRPYVLAALLTICTPIAALAQADESQKGPRPLFVIGASYDARNRGTVEGGLLVPLSLGMDPDAVLGECRCLLVTAGVGPGGQRLAIGAAYELLYPPVLFAGLDAVATVLRTSNAPRGARPDTTYVGAEGGFTYWSVRVGVGFAHSVSGLGPHRNVVTWNLGYRVGW